MKSSNIVIIDKDGTIPLTAFKSIINVKRVVWYDLTPVGSCLILRFFDKNKKLIKAKTPRKRVKKKDK